MTIYNAPVTPIWCTVLLWVMFISCIIVAVYITYDALRKFIGHQGPVIKP